MPLEIYKRSHKPKCLEAIAKRVAAGEIGPAVDMKQYRTCKCVWWIGGTNDYGVKIPRHSLKVYSYEAACEAMRKLNHPDADDDNRVTLQGALDEWRTAFENAHEHDPDNPHDTRETIRHYNMTADRLLAFAKLRRITYVKDFKTAHIDDYIASWKNEKTGKRLKFSTRRMRRVRLNTFFTFCFKREHIKRNPMLALTKMESPAGREHATLPLDDKGNANYQKIIASVIPFLRGEFEVKPQGFFVEHPEAFQTLLEVMYHTGLRISDAIHFEVDKIETTAGCTEYTTPQIKVKTKEVTVCFLPDEQWLVEKLRKLPRLDPEGRYVFLNRRKGWKNFILNNVNSVLRSLSKAIGIPGIRCHRFRDSFAVNQLLEGHDMEALKEMLGHKSVLTTERYYMPWNKARKDALYANRLRRREEANTKNIVAINQKRSA